MKERCQMTNVVVFCCLQGFMRVFNDMTEIVLDVPNAYHILSKFVERCLSSGVVSPVMAEQVPQRYSWEKYSNMNGHCISKVMMIMIISSSKYKSCEVKK